MSFKKIDYEQVVGTAILAAVRNMLTMVAKNGLCKKQHFYITFATQHPGVRISDVIAEEFDEEMTIVLQYEFWDLKVDNYGFSVTLAFEHDDETLYIPFSSIISVSDPSEDFSLEFRPNFTDVKDGKAKGPKSNVVTLDSFRNNGD
jgi:hypothetical protein